MLARFQLVEDPMFSSAFDCSAVTLRMLQQVATNLSISSSCNTLTVKLVVGTLVATCNKPVDATSLAIVLQQVLIICNILDAISTVSHAIQTHLHSLQQNY